MKKKILAIILTLTFPLWFLPVTLYMCIYMLFINIFNIIYDTLL